MIGVYFEGGIGQVEGKQHTTEAKGDSRYYGSGLLLKYDLPILQGLYIQGGIKGGKTDNDIRSNVMKDHGGKRGGYDRKQTYWAAHAGIGYRYALQDNLELDTELKYLWTHLKGANLNIGGDPIKLDGLTSHRIRAGSRLNYGLDAQNKVYAGISWEYEFAGDAKVRAYNVTLRGDEYKGHSGIIELGININPASNRNLVIEAGFEGYLGKNKGLGGGIEIKYSF